jgi:hypothetical protein
MFSAIGLMLAVQPGVLRRAKLFNAFGVVSFLISPQIRNAVTLVTAFLHCITNADILSHYPIPCALKPAR